jgi:GSH-dependent disulfide-bond oxidoreductase
MMYKLYAFSTPNSVRVPIALEEMGLPYEIATVNVRRGEQKSPEFLAINPNGKVPVLVVPKADGDEPLVLSESGAILIYLAEETGKLLPRFGAGRARVLEQMFFHLTGIGPAFGQLGFFKRQASEQIPSAINRFAAESERVLAVLDKALSKNRYVAGDDFTIADITHFGWLWRREFAGIDFTQTPHIGRWYEVVAARPAVQRALARVAALVPQA